MDKSNKITKKNKILIIVLVLLSIFNIIFLINKKSYALFKRDVTSNKRIVEIHTVSEFPKSIISILKEKTNTNDAELIAIDVTDKNNIKKCESLEACKGKIIEYRYSGPTANNYLKLTNNNGVEEDWRIIGIFSDESGDEYLRVVRDLSLPETYLPTNYIVEGTTYKIKGSSNTVFWNYQAGDTTDKNDWSIAGLQYYLNSEQDTSGNNGFLSYLSSDVKKLLVAKKLYLGTVTYTNNFGVTDTTKQAYKYERATDCSDGKGKISNYNGFTDTEACRVWNGNSATWTGKIGLMYPSDYGFSASETYWDSTTLCNYMEQGKETSWIYSTMSDTKMTTSSLISPLSTIPYFASRVRGDGAVTGCFVYYAENVARPVLNLSGTLTRVYDGDGTSKSSAYKVIAY